MKNRDIFLPSLSSLLIAGMISFLSCAHQNRVKDELDAQADETSLEDSTASANSEEAQTDDLVLDEDVKSSDTTVTENTSTDSSSDELKLDEDLTALNETTTSTTEKTTTTETTSDELALENDLNNTTTTATETKGAVGDTAGDELALESDSLDLDVANGTSGAAGAVASNETTKTEELNIPPQEPEPAPTRVEPQETAPIVDNSSLSLGSESKPAGSSYSGHSRVPHIPAKAVTRKGTKLNRFYFVRKGDTPSTTSELIYGSKDQTKQLAKWNGKNWKAGSIIYYVSPTDPKEKTMRSFYQERNVTPEEYTVQSGDWLSRVASKKLGNAGSWKEIAVVNGMKKPDALEVGQKLAIYPLDLAGSSSSGQVAKEEQDETTSQNVARQQEPEKQPEAVQPPPQTQEIVPPVVEPPVAQIPVEQPKVKKEEASSNFDIAKMIDQNMFFGVIGVAVLLLCAAYLMRKRKKAAKEAGDDFGEDGFQPPTKLKRK